MDDGSFPCTMLLQLYSIRIVYTTHLSLSNGIAELSPLDVFSGGLSRVSNA